jgi:hypothetical protein
MSTAIDICAVVPQFGPIRSLLLLGLLTAPCCSPLVPFPLRITCLTYNTVRYKSLKIIFQVFCYMFRPKIAIIRCLQFSSYKESADFAAVSVDINLTSAYHSVCACVCVATYSCAAGVYMTAKRDWFVSPYGLHSGTVLRNVDEPVEVCMGSCGRTRCPS